MAGRLEGKVAFITGAARGQGRSHAVRLAQEGADIIAVDICRQIDTVPYPCDIVLANAGIAPMSLREPHDAWQDVIDVNLTGVFNTVEIAIPSMIERGKGGAIVLTSSTAGINGIGGPTRGGLGYTASKHALVGLMRSYANNLAPHSIRVNSVHPTGVRTPMVVNDVMQEFLGQDRSLSDLMPNALPVDMVESVDVSNAILWLVSDDARYVTGITVPVDAGYTNKK